MSPSPNDPPPGHDPYSSDPAEGAQHEDRYAPADPTAERPATPAAGTPPGGVPPQGSGEGLPPAAPDRPPSYPQDGVGRSGAGAAPGQPQAPPDAYGSQAPRPGDPHAPVTPQTGQRPVTPGTPASVAPQPPAPAPNPPPVVPPTGGVRPPAPPPVTPVATPEPRQDPYAPSGAGHDPYDPYAPPKPVVEPNYGLPSDDGPDAVEQLTRGNADPYPSQGGSAAPQAGSGVQTLDEPERATTGTVDDPYQSLQAQRQELYEAAGKAQLPAALHYSRKEELEETFEQLIEAKHDRVDGSLVAAVDSEGIELLVNAVRRAEDLGLRILIEAPSEALKTARRALHLRDRLPFVEEDEDDLEPELNQRLLGEVLVELGFIDDEQLDEAVKASNEDATTQIGQYLLDKGYASEEQLFHGLAAQHGLPFVLPATNHVLDVTLEHNVPFAELRSHNVLPFLRLGDLLAVAVTDPSDVYAVDVVRRYSSLTVLASVTAPAEIQKGLDLLQRASGGHADVRGVAAAQAALNVQELFDEILLNATIEGASDIHLEPQELGYLLRFRVDGRLRDIRTFNHENGNSLTARIKVLAGCDISEKRRPQDGRIHFAQEGRDVDLRVNTLPTVYGEKSVMRVIDRNTGHIPLGRLGFAGDNLARIEEAISLPHGMVLVTGPTGSGKSTTLYSVLGEIISPEINISTVENPVERQVPGVNQTQVNHKAGMTFENALRSLVRQDPDVIMIGEIRDKETAQIAVEAALTGHLVLATLHTNDAPGAATRLVQMGVEPFLVAATLRAVVAQRLVRKLCEPCKAITELPAAVKERYMEYQLGQEGPVYAATGCAACRKSGYDGRQGVFEVMTVTPELQDLIARNPSTLEVRELALQSSMTPLIADAMRRVNAGETSLEEVLRAAVSE